MSFQDKYMILLKDKKSNLNKANFQESIIKYNNGNTNMDIQCSKCHSEKLVCHGYYKRDIIYEQNNKIISKRIKIKRVKCKKCKTTHALLPIDIVPYKRVTLSIIIKCIYDKTYYNKTNFSFEVREKWIKQYRTLYPYLKTLLVNNIYEKIIKNTSLFYEKLYNETKKVLFLIKKSTYNIGFL